jgi:hypothetical protein
MRTRKTPTKGRGGKPDAEKMADPSGHDRPRQVLSELRRIIDAAGHRIGRIFIRMHHEV